jgi:uncharacterized protein (DUF1697 family)
MHAIAFLRGINLGGHNVKKDQLITIFESVGCANATTFIASGNVVFDKPSGSVAALEKKAEEAFVAALGYEAATFIRTTTQLKAVVKNRPFDGRGPETGGTLHVHFLKRKAKPEEVKAVRGLEDDVNEFHFDGTTLYWHTRTPRMSDSGMDAKKLERAIGQPHTARSIKTIYNILEKWKA